MHAQDSVIGLYNSGGDLRTTPHGEGDLALLPIVHRQTLEHEATQAGSCASSASVVNAESLKTGACQYCVNLFRHLCLQAVQGLRTV